MLTERECEAMQHERDIIYAHTQAYKDAEHDSNRAHEDRMRQDRERDYALYQQRLHLGWYESAREIYHAQLLLQIQRGIQTQIARRMAVSEPRVSQLLSSASLVMGYLQEVMPFAGWKEELKGRKRVFTLVAKVAVTQKSGQIIVGNFTPAPLEKVA